MNPLCGMRRELRRLRPGAVTAEDLRRHRHAVRRLLRWRRDHEHVAWRSRCLAFLRALKDYHACQ